MAYFSKSFVFLYISFLFQSCIVYYSLLRVKSQAFKIKVRTHAVLQVVFEAYSRVLVQLVVREACLLRNVLPLYLGRLPSLFFPTL